MLLSAWEDRGDKKTWLEEMSAGLCNDMGGKERGTGDIISNVKRETWRGGSATAMNEMLAKTSCGQSSTSRHGACLPSVNKRIDK